MKSLELRWGVIIGGANLCWLYASFYFGMHTRGIGLVQVMALIGVLITVFGYIFALRAVKRAQPEIGYIEGVKSGVMIAGVAALFAVVAQVGYFLVVHPEWPEYMAEQTRIHYTEEGLSQELVEEHVKYAEKAFNLRSYSLQSAIFAIFQGVLFSLLIMAFLKRKGA